ncbi:MAG: SMP-30/gluconolactonase/LRE family protein [Thaumarchaeota archaeon]|nr:SMP-30/gluconolactonase/LRE family protein [Nitrososphaerota archaeon]
MVILLILVLPFADVSSFQGSQHDAILSATLSQLNQTGYQMAQYPLPNGSSAPFAIATDPSGLVWVAEQGSNQIGSFDPKTDVFREYAVPTPNSGVTSIATDNNSDTWFTELNSDHLGELRNGIIKEYGVPGSTVSVGGQIQNQACGPTGVVVDGSNGIWIICIFSNQIDEFFPNNDSFLRFNLPVFQSGPAGLVFDHSGNFWFTAADAAMIGRGIISQLKDNTSNGISEFSPLNSTYVFSFQRSANFLGSTVNVQSSLPTPSGIALARDGKTLWITEHVDSSFDSFNTQSNSLNRFWTSKTNNEFGYSVSLPNGIGVDGQGKVWIAEHYGNKIGEFDPTTNSLTEYEVPCCTSTSAGVYTLTLGQNKTVWFVEIFGNAIGELRPVPVRSGISIELKQDQPRLDPSSSFLDPVEVIQSAPSDFTSNISLDISGISNTGILNRVQGDFAPKSLQLTGTGNATSNLKLSTQSLNSGIYYLTVSAKQNPGGIIYSTILKLVVTSSNNQLLISGAVIGSVASVVVVFILAFRMKSKKKRLMHSDPKFRRSRAIG